MDIAQFKALSAVLHHERDNTIEQLKAELQREKAAHKRTCDEYNTVHEKHTLMKAQRGHLMLLIQQITMQQLAQEHSQEQAQLIQVWWQQMLAIVNSAAINDPEVDIDIDDDAEVIDLTD